MEVFTEKQICKKCGYSLYTVEFTNWHLKVKCNRCGFIKIVQSMEMILKFLIAIKENKDD